jgi:glycosyltransferase involved in cell wall biosynthesis
MRKRKDAKKHHAKKPMVSLIIPAYNEERTIERMVKECDKVLKHYYKSFEILLMDDCSTDRTLQICKSLERSMPSLRVHSNKENFGKTKTVMQGLRLVHSDIMAFIDADYQYSPDDLPRVIDKVLREGYDLCSGKRGTRQDSLKRKIASSGFNLFNKVMFGITLTDINCGLKAMKKSIFDLIEVRYLDARWFIDTEILAQASAKGLRVTEIGIHHMPRQEGDSKVSVIDLATETMWYGARMKMRLLLGTDRADP